MTLGQVTDGPTTSGPVGTRLQDGVLIVTLSLGPSNSLVAALRRALLAAISGRPAGVQAMVLTGAGANFSSELPTDAGPDDPPLAELCAALAGAGVPVVAALQGLALGSGAGLALAATARVGQQGCRIALPEVAFGMCSAGGTSRRLARLIGAEAALRLMLSGRVVGADEARHLGLLDAVEPDALTAAIALAQRLAGGEGLARKTEPATSWQAAVTAARRANARALPATRGIIDCVEAALLLPPEAADRFEAVTRADLAATPEAAGLCAAARAERRAARLPPAVARAAPLPLTALGLVGEGAGLVTLARAALGQGVAVRWLHPSAATMMASLGTVDAQDLRHVDDPAEIANLPLQVHQRAPKASGWPPMTPGRALLVLDGAEGEMGLAIAPSARACELAVVAEEAPQAIATALAGLRRLQIAPLLVGRQPGIGLGVLRAGDAALEHLAATGVAPSALSAALAGFGRTIPRTATAPTPREMAGDEITRRWLAAMAAEGLRLVEQGLVRRPSDIDLALIAGHGFARWQGGPMHQAERRGLMVLRHDLRLWSGESALWSPPQILDRLIRDGVTLAALNGD
jgi:3-hydroxyacyl-CoA dehydrogenase